MRLIIGLIFITSCLGQIRVNVGGPQYTDTEGQTWAADTGCTSNSEYTYAGAITGTSNPTLYQTGRTSTSSLNCTYNLVTNNYYVVTMKFAEYNRTYTNPKTPRLMNIIINGVQYYTAVNIFQMCGFASACDLTPAFIPVNDNGQISVTITQQQGQPMLSAISIMPVGELGLDASQISYLYPQGVIQTVQTKLQQEINVKDFGAVGDWTSGTNGTDNCTPFTRAAGALAAGGDLYFAPGKYRSSCSITQVLPAHYRGAGRGDTCDSSPTCLVFAAGVNGIVNTNTSRGSSVENMWIQSLDDGANSDNGLTVGDSWFYGHLLGISSFGNAGVYNTANNVNYMHLSQILSTLNYGDGFYCSNSDCGEMIWENLVSQNNAGIGFHGQMGHTLFFNDVVEGTGTGAWSITGLSNTFQSPYCEGTTPTFAMGGNFSQLFGQFAGGCTVTNSGGASNFIQLSGLYNNQLRLTGVNPQDANNEYYALYSGVDGTQCFSLKDEGINPGVSPTAVIMKYCPGTPNVLTFPSVAPTLTDLVVVQSSHSTKGLTVDSQSSDGGGSINSAVALKGKNSANAGVIYGQMYTEITTNTSGSEAAKIHIQNQQAGTLTDGIVLQQDGTTAMKPVTTCSGHPTGTLWNNSGTLAICP